MRFTLPLSLVAHALLLLTFVVAPLVAGVEMPSPPSLRAAFHVLDVHLPPPPPPPAARAARPAAEAAPSREAAPVVAPSEIRPETGPPGSPEGPPGGMPGGIPGGIEPWAGGARLALPAPPRPALPERVTPGGRVRPPQKIVDVRPAYPPLARQARIEGVVILDATIGPEGDVQGLRAIKSVPLLDEAALAAVRQWKFTPTLLNGTPVSVIMTVRVNFTLR
jgi:protein TonB